MYSHSVRLLELSDLLDLVHKVPAIDVLHHEVETVLRGGHTGGDQGIPLPHFGADSQPIAELRSERDGRCADASRMMHVPHKNTQRVHPKLHACLVCSRRNMQNEQYVWILSIDKRVGHGYSLFPLGPHFIGHTK